MADREFPLQEGANLIGRGRGCYIILPDAKVSRQHAVIHRKGNRVTITDLGSTNGTFLDGRRIQPHQPHLLRPDITITIGDSILTIRWIKAEPADGARIEKRANLRRPLLALVLTFALIIVLLVAGFILAKTLSSSPQEITQEPSQIELWFTQVPTIVRDFATSIATVVPTGVPPIPLPVGTPPAPLLPLN